MRSERTVWKVMMLWDLDPVDGCVGGGWTGRDDGQELNE